MKRDIHPDYQTCTVTCGCGNTFTTRSTRAKIAVEICSSCHPFFTGKQKFVDTAGMVEKFQKKFASLDYAAAKAPKPKKAAPPKAAPKAVVLGIAPGIAKAPPPIPGKERRGKGAGAPGAPPAAGAAAAGAKPVGDAKSEKAEKPAKAEAKPAAPAKPAPPPGKA